MFFNVRLFWLHFCVSKQKVFHVPTVPSMLLSSVIHIFLFLVLNCNKIKSVFGRFRTIYQIQWNYTLFPYILNFLYIFLIYNNQTYTYLFLLRQHLSLLKVSVRFMGHSVLYSVGETSSGHLSRSWSPEESHERPPLRVCKQERDSGSGHLHGGLKLKLLHLSASVNQASSSRINLSLKKMWCNLFYI